MSINLEPPPPPVFFSNNFLSSRKKKFQYKSGILLNGSPPHNDWMHTNDNQGGMSHREQWSQKGTYH